MKLQRIGLTASLSIGVIASACAQDPAAADSAKGRRLFIQCAACHDVGPGTYAKIGPPLNGVVGRPVASVAGYQYSASLKALSFDWDAARLDLWLQKPTQIAPDTSMAFAGIADPAERRAIIVYLSTLK